MSTVWKRIDRTPSSVSAKSWSTESQISRGPGDFFNIIAARSACPRELWPVVRRKLTQLNRIREVRELAIPPGNGLERLAGARHGQHSIRINQQYRVCFRWEAGYANEVEVTDYH